MHLSMWAVSGSGFTMLKIQGTCLSPRTLAWAGTQILWEGILLCKKYKLFSTITFFKVFIILVSENFLNLTTTPYHPPCFSGVCLHSQEVLGVPGRLDSSGMVYSLLPAAFPETGPFLVKHSFSHSPQAL